MWLRKSNSTFSHVTIIRGEEARPAPPMAETVVDHDLTQEVVADSKPIDVSRYYCKFTLHKCGSLPNEFSEALNTKIKSLLKKFANEQQQQVSNSRSNFMEYAIKSVLSNLSFSTEKLRKPDRMRRNGSSTNSQVSREDCTGASQTVPPIASLK